MGSIIHLAVGRLEIDWGKNFGFTDHSALFQITDLAKVPYYYAEEGSAYVDDAGENRWKIIAEYKDGLSKPLCEVIDRIELLGHTLAVCEKKFNYLSKLIEFDARRFRFDQLRAALAAIDVSAISTDYGEGGEDFGKFFGREIFPRLGLSKIVDDPWSPILDRAMRETMSGIGLWLDNSNQSPDETVDEILRRAWNEGELR